MLNFSQYYGKFLTPIQKKELIFLFISLNYIELEKYLFKNK
jgi:hypothetical protein